jgi:uracil-DNA glycosylase family 4
MKRDEAEKLEAWLEYFRDLGLNGWYRGRTAPARTGFAAATKTESGFVRAGAAGAPATAPAPVAHIPILEAPSLFEAAERVETDSLERIREDIGECTRCKLCRSRTRIVFGDGDPHAELVFVGEGPGQAEDMQGRPFVGRAGKLLDRLIVETGLERRSVYIANVVKCRPPGNRTPEKDEIATCLPFLFRQLAVVHPRVIVCLGSVAASALLGVNRPVGQLRGQWFDWRGSRVLVTYHTAFVLRNPSAIAEVRADLKKAVAFLGIPARKPGARPAR